MLIARVVTFGTKRMPLSWANGARVKLPPDTLPASEKLGRASTGETSIDLMCFRSKTLKAERGYSTVGAIESIPFLTVTDLGVENPRLI